MVFGDFNSWLPIDEHDKQRAELVKLRNLPGYRSAPNYIYSRGQPDQPDLGDVEGRFFK